MEAFIMHPLFVKIQNNCTCVINTLIPNSENYALHILSFPHDDNDITENLNRTLQSWLARRNINPLVSKIGILDVHEQKIFVVDMLAEKNDDIILLLMFRTTKRATHYQKMRMQCYAQIVKETTEKTYKFIPTVLIINVYGPGNIASFNP